MIKKFSFNIWRIFFFYTQMPYLRYGLTSMYSCLVINIVRYKNVIYMEICSNAISLCRFKWKVAPEKMSHKTFLVGRIIRL